MLTWLIDGMLTDVTRLDAVVLSVVDCVSPWRIVGSVDALDALWDYETLCALFLFYHVYTQTVQTSQTHP